MMKKVLLLCSLLSSSASGEQPAAPLGQMVIPAAQPFVTLAVNGQQLRLKVDLGAHGAIILNPQAAARAGLAEDEDVTMRIGPVKLRGSDARAAFELDGSRWESRVMWFDRNYLDDADGVIGPHHLPFAEIVFQGPESAPRPSFTLEVTYTEGRGVFVPTKIAGKKVAVRFSLLQQQSFATGSAGALLAKQHNGTLEGVVVPQRIGWDVIRPTRRLALLQPWLVGRFSLRNILVRLRDFRGKSVLRSADTDAGPKDILVTGRLRERQDAEHFLTVGLDTLQTCYSITYSRVRSQLIFRC